MRKILKIFIILVLIGNYVSAQEPVIYLQKVYDTLGPTR
jgi:hypothetical protein